MRRSIHRREFGSIRGQPQASSPAEQNILFSQDKVTVRKNPAMRELLGGDSKLVTSIRLRFINTNSRPVAVVAIDTSVTRRMLFSYPREQSVPVTGTQVRKPSPR